MLGNNLYHKHWQNSVFTYKAEPGWIFEGKMNKCGLGKAIRDVLDLYIIHHLQVVFTL